MALLITPLIALLIAQVGSIPRLKQRLEAFDFKHKFNGVVHQLWAEIKCVTTAAEQLVRCEPLQRLLGVLLALGNALNQGTHRANTEGFRLECLTRLAELKTSSEQSSLLQYAVAVAGGQDAPLADGEAAAPLASLNAECGAVKDAAKLATAELLEEVGKLRRGLALVHGELEHFHSARKEASKAAAAGTADDALVAERFVQVMQPFHDSAVPLLDELACSATRMEEAQRVLRTYYAEEAKASIDEVYSRWATFLGQVDVAVTHHNEDRKRAEAKLKRGK